MLDKATKSGLAFWLMEISFGVVCVLSFWRSLDPHPAPLEMFGIPVGLIMGPAGLVLMLFFYRTVVGRVAEFSEWVDDMRARHQAEFGVCASRLSAREKQFLEAKSPRIRDKFLTVVGVAAVMSGLATGAFLLSGYKGEWFVVFRTGTTFFAYVFAFILFRHFVQTWKTTVAIRRKCRDVRGNRPTVGPR